MENVNVIVPVLNENCQIDVFLRSLNTSGFEITVVDGGSTDGTWQSANKHSVKLLLASRGRALQMIEGASHANEELLWFLHADSKVDPAAFDQISKYTIAHSGQEYWGRFDVTIDDSAPIFRVIETLMNWRSRVTSIATGDQGIFVTRRLYERVGGYQNIPLMEDIDLSKRLRVHSRALCFPGFITTSARRWRNKGILRTIFLMWMYRLLYWLGVSPEKIARWYYPAGS